MGEHIDDKPFPKGALLAAAFLISATIVSATTARLTGLGATRLTPAPVVEAAELRFLDLSDGGIGVNDADSNREIVRLAPGESGFVRVVLRGLAYDRSKQGQGPEAPFVLSQRSDGALLLEDPVTTRVVTLGAFGHDNLKAFQALLDKGKKQQ